MAVVMVIMAVVVGLCEVGRRMGWSGWEWWGCLVVGIGADEVVE